MSMADEKRPLLCRLGFHSWYIDAAMFTWAKRCSYCGKYKNREQGARLVAERHAWGETDGMTTEQARAHVRKQMEVIG